MIGLLRSNFDSFNFDTRNFDTDSHLSLLVRFLDYSVKLNILFVYQLFSSVFGPLHLLRYNPF